MKKYELFDEPLVLRYRGPYDYDGLMSTIRKYYKKVQIDLKEKKFKHKTGGSGAEVEFKFTGDRKVTQFIKVHLHAEGHLWDVKPKEQVVDGQKKMITGGKMEIVMSSEIELDYAKKFENDSKWMGKLEKWMQEVVSSPTGIAYGDIKMTGEDFAKKLATDLQEAIKKHLKMTCV